MIMVALSIVIVIILLVVVFFCIVVVIIVISFVIASDFSFVGIRIRLVVVRVRTILLFPSIISVCA